MLGFGQELSGWDRCGEAASIVAGGTAGAARPLSAAEQRCCVALTVWQEIEAVGGCGGIGGDPELDCRIAEDLCEECNTATASVVGSNSTALAPVAVTVAAGEGISLSALGPEALEMRCALPRLSAGCTDSMADIGLGFVLIAGMLILVLSIGFLALFNHYLLPPLIARFQRLLQAPIPGRDAAGKRLRRPLPPPPLLVIEQPPAEPLSWTLRERKSPGVRSLSSAPSRTLGATAGEAELDGGCEAPTSPPSDESTTAADALRVAADAGDGCRGPAPIEWPEPEHPRPDTALSLDSAGSLSSAESGGGGRWPLRIARVWALRVVVVRVAGFCAAARVADAILRVALAADSSEGTSSLAILPELLLTVPPLAWCAWVSRPPANPDRIARRNIPDSAAFCFPCGRTPRFTALAALIVALELYSTAVAAAAVAKAPCDIAPWRVIFPYCLGVGVAVARAYSALLALRLQDELAGACRRVLPIVSCDSASFGSPSFGGFSDFSNITAPPEPECGPSSIGAESADFIDTVIAEAETTKFTGGSGPKPSREGWWAPMRVPVPKPKPAASSASGCCAWLRWCCRCGCLTLRSALLCAALLAMLSATASALIARFAVSQKTETDLPSSCVTAQNATSTCQPFRIVGKELWDYDVEASMMDTADTMEDCCRLCDDLDDCNAWMYEKVGKRCRWIGFTEDPCKRNPGDLRCRCTTQFETSFGFKPTSRIIWVQRGS